MLMKDLLGLDVAWQACELKVQDYGELYGQSVCMLTLLFSSSCNKSLLT